jgi:dipeptidase E
MKKIILTSSGFEKNKTLKQQFLKLLPSLAKRLSVVIITTASAEWKEKNKHAILAKKFLENMGFRKVEFLDVEFENPNRLKKFDIIYINGGNPFYLLYYLKKSSSDKIITQISDKGAIIIGVSAGAVVLGPNINIVNYFDKKLNIVKLKNFTALNLTNIIIYPHYKKDSEEKIEKFESKFNCKVKRLSDDQSIVITK